MMVFRANGKEYYGSSALEIVDTLSGEAGDSVDRQLSTREFVLRSLEDLRGRIPLSELGGTRKLDDELLALSYLYLRDECGAGELVNVPGRKRWAHPL